MNDVANDVVSVTNHCEVCENPLKPNEDSGSCLACVVCNEEAEERELDRLIAAKESREYEEEDRFNQRWANW